MKVEDLEVFKIEAELKKLRIIAIEDAFFDRSKIETAFDNTEKVMRWIDRKVKWVKLLRILEIELRQKRRALYEFYKVDFNMKLDNRDEMNLFITSDPQYCDVEDKYIMCQTVKKFIDATIDTLKARAWEVKGFAEYQKFIHGA